ncbi:lytic transglycosylase domain-containing protein [Methylococcus capsulatus]|nr:lytic transglycosylase domain-containing protein [Methylococcus capsulatus]QXP92734.1 lytic transglycosylase domain-containing protein [Methylococcus capsulatus]
MFKPFARGLMCIAPVLLLVACSSHTVAPKKDSLVQSVPSTGSDTPRDLDFMPRSRPRAEYMTRYLGVFPRYPALEPQVAFWRKVYAEWSRSQVALHDDRYLGLIYEVVDLPGEAGGGFTPSQKARVQERFDYWKYRLRNLEDKLASRAPLDAADQQLARRIDEQADLRTAIRGAAERLRYQRGLRERFKRGLEISGRYDEHFRRIFRNAGLPEELALLPHVESSFQANARSSAGAVGIWQFTAGAAKTFMNGQDSVAARLDPIASAHGAARYLSHAYGKLGSWPLAVTSYNHGIGGMQKAKNVYGHNFERIVQDYDHPLFGFASRNYYAEFLAAVEIAADPERFFPEGVNYEDPLDEAPSPFTVAGKPSVPLVRPVLHKVPAHPLKGDRVTSVRFPKSLHGKAGPAHAAVSLRPVAKARTSRPVVAAIGRSGEKLRLARSR